MSKLFKNRVSSCCVAVGCNMRAGTNFMSQVKMFCFPKNPERRKRWENAVHRENWTATASSRLCNRHFITGKPSLDPLHPDYIPSVFDQKTSLACSRKQKIGRYERRLKRVKVDKSIPHTNNEDKARTRKRLKRSALPSLYLPLSSTDNAEMIQCRTAAAIKHADRLKERRKLDEYLDEETLSADETLFSIKQEYDDAVAEALLCLGSSSTTAGSGPSTQNNTSESISSSANTDNFTPIIIKQEIKIEYDDTET